MKHFVTGLLTLLLFVAGDASASLKPRALDVQCTQPSGALKKWYYSSRAHGPYVCTRYYNNKGYWAMLNAYRSGGVKNRHWRYTNNQNDSRCLENWSYWSSDGQTMLMQIQGRTTTKGDKNNKRWCALPVHRPGDVLDKQWAYCNCTNNSTD